MIMDIGFAEQLCDLVFFFFFQAEDGIRDTSVTGVQTCALPISSSSRHARQRRRRGTRSWPSCTRSEERRVGKECRSRWWADHSKKKEDGGGDGRGDRASSCGCGRQSNGVG